MSFLTEAWGADRAADATEDAARNTNATNLQIFNQIRDDNAPYREGGYGAYSALQALLGLGGDPAASQQAFDTYRGSTGYDFRLGEGTKAIERSAAARGGLNSGATLKALARYGQDYGSNEFSNYLGQLQGVIAPGQAALGQNAQAGMNYGSQVGQANAMAGQGRASAYQQFGQSGGQAADSMLGYFFGGG